MCEAVPFVGNGITVVCMFQFLQLFFFLQIYGDGYIGM